jgi:hypothetical protein
MQSINKAEKVKPEILLNIYPISVPMSKIVKNEKISD